AAAIFVFAVLYVSVLVLLSTTLPNWFNISPLFTLSLPGIAGIVLSIGVAADSSILILERFKEEIRMGRSVRASSITGVKHAIITSIDADLVALVSALALFFIAVGAVKGFGLTLAFGVICDILTMLLFKAPLIRLLAPKVIARHPGFWGIKEDEELAMASGELDRLSALETQRHTSTEQKRGDSRG
ncbi:MAG: MMPL family transporter, partial [Coriobacteriia bacterium]|nr:MMPL family transporter [Coriobacteriia bacterium]